MAVAFKNHRSEMIALREAQQRFEEARRRDELKRGARDWEAMKATVRADREAAAKTKAAEAAEVERMTPAQLAAREHQRQTQIPKRTAARPDYYSLAAEEIAREDKAKEREERERDAGLPKMQAKYDARLQEINDARDAAIRDAGERCRADEQAARDKAQHELDQLGERPNLAALEAKI